MKKDDYLTQRYEETRKVTLVGAVVNLLLSSAQLLGGFFTHSQGLIADGVHTLSDLASDFIVIIAAKEAGRKADKEHPYGHGRIETLATSILGIMLVAVAGGIFVDTIGRLFSPERLLHPTKFALIFALMAVVSKESLYHYTKNVGNRINSNMLIANAWHHRSDAISSLLVIIGIIVSLAGVDRADAIAAMGVALMIGKMGFDLLWKSAQELIDASLDDETVSKIKAAATSVDGVINLHQLRTRQSGADAFVDVHIQVAPRISVSEGHQISETVRYAISKALPLITDVTVHTDAEDDCTAPSCDGLPSRSALLQLIKEHSKNNPLADSVSEIRLHYLSANVEVELFLASSPSSKVLETSEESLVTAISNIPEVSTVKLFYFSK